MCVWERGRVKCLKYDKLVAVVVAQTIYFVLIEPQWTKASLSSHAAFYIKGVASQAHET